MITRGSAHKKVIERGVVQAEGLREITHYRPMIFSPVQISKQGSFLALEMLGRLEVCSVLSLGWALTQLGAGNALYCIAQRFVELTQSFEPETADSNEAVKKLLTNLTPSAADVIEADYNEYLHRGSWRGFTTGCNCEQE